MAKPVKAIGLLVLVGTTGVSHADVVDLSVDKFGSIGGALYERADFRAGGSGVISSFVRVSGNSAVVQGYNTSGRPVAFNENSSPIFTHDLTFGAIPQRVVNGVSYAEFMLDINQQAANPLLSLDDVEIYTSASGGQTTSNVPGLGSLVYSMDVGGDNFVRLDYNLGTGSGQGDMRLLVPVSMFGGATPGTFVYLYSRFGENNANNDGYEEWAVVDSSVIPLPPAAWIGLAGLGLVGLTRRRLGITTARGKPDAGR